MGWKIYAEDNNGNLVPNHDGNDTKQSWVAGLLSFAIDNRANTTVQ